MTWLRMVMARFNALLRKKRLEQELDDELRAHREMLAEENERKGMSPEEAHYAALREFGGVEQAKELYREQRGLPMIETLIQDIRYGFRTLAKSPGFAAVVILSLALGIGANTAIFSLIDAVMLKMLPVKQPEQLVLLRWAWRGRPGVMPDFIHNLTGDSDDDPTGRLTSTSFSYPFFEGVHSQKQVFSNVLAFANADRLNLSSAGQPGSAACQFVSGDYFSALGVQAMVGRVIASTDDAPGAAPAAAISYGYWTRRFGRDPSVLGKTISVNGVPFTLVGVAAPEFFGLEPGTSIDVWIPLRTQPQVMPSWTESAIGGTSKFLNSEDWWVVILGRLKPGVTEPQARAALDVKLSQSVAAIGKAATKHSGDRTLEPPKIDLTPAGKGLDALRREFSQPLFILMAVVGLVLLIACANVANLLLARATARQKEIAVRLALGAGRRRLIRQLLTESLLLASAGAALGLIFAYWASDVLLALMSSGRNHIALHVSPDLEVLGFTAVVSLLTGIIFGLAPALRGTRLDLTPALRESASGFAGARRHAWVSRFDLSKALVISQIAMSLLLLIGAGLFVRTLTNLENEDIGFDRRNLLLFGIDPTQAGYKGANLANFYQELQRRIGGLPGVRSASLSRHTLIDGGISIDGFSIQGYTPKPGEAEDGSVAVHFNAVGPRFFETFGIPLVLGRAISERDDGGAPRVAVINSTLARKFFEGSNPIGRRFGGENNKSSDISIVGVVSDTKYGQLRAEAPPTVYVPYAQNIEGLGAMDFEVRTDGDPKRWTSAVHQTVQELDKNLPLFDVKTQTEQIDQATFQERLSAALSSVFGLLALVLACVGLYGIMAYAVARRTHEIGIRMALGAERGNILRMVVREALLLVIPGTLVGVTLALAASRVIASMLYGLKPTDPVTIVAAVGLMASVAVLAGYLPARRASRVDPMVALRYE